MDSNWTEINKLFSANHCEWKQDFSNLLDVRHNYWSFLMKFSNYCSDMVMNVVNTGSLNRSCWHWWAECHVERQALPLKWETWLTTMQFNPNTCIFISIKDFQTHSPHIDSRKLSPAACHTIWTRYPLCDSTSSCKRIKWMRMSQTSQAATGTCKSKSKSDGKLPLRLMLPLRFYGSPQPPPSSTQHTQLLFRLLQAAHLVNSF